LSNYFLFIFKIFFAAQIVQCKPPGNGMENRAYHTRKPLIWRINSGTTNVFTLLSGKDYCMKEPDKL